MLHASSCMRLMFGLENSLILVSKCLIKELSNLYIFLSLKAVFKYQIEDLTFCFTAC